MTTNNRVACAIFMVGLGLPFFWPGNVNVMPSFYNEVIAYVVWGIGLGALLYTIPLSPLDFSKSLRLTAPAVAIFVLQCLVLLVQYFSGKSIQYLGIVSTTILALMAAAMCTISGAHAQIHAASKPSAGKLLTWCVYTIIFIGGMQAIFGWLQYFGLHSQLPFISKLTTPGRAFGNLRQANLYALLLVISITSTLWIVDHQKQLSRISKCCLLLLVSVCVGAVALSASRIGFVLLCGIGIWGLYELKFSKIRAGVLVCIPLIYLAFRWCFTMLSQQGILPYHGDVRGIVFTQAANMDRISIWTAATKVIHDFPLLGVGYKRFAQQVFENGHAFNLTVHTENVHNLLLQWALDFGTPMAAILCGLVVFCFYNCRSLLKTFAGRTIWFCLLAPLLHHLIEYPLEYVYFLFPWAFTMGVALGMAARTPNTSSTPASLGYGYGGSAINDSGIENKRTGPFSGWAAIPLAMVVAPIFAAYDIQKILPSYDVTAYAIPHERLTKAYGTVLFTYFADYSALRILPPAPHLAAVQLSLAKKVSYFRFDDIVASVYARSAALIGQECLAKAVTYRIWLSDKKAFASFKSEVEQTDYPQMGFLKSFVLAPTAVAWPSGTASACT